MVYIYIMENNQNTIKPGMTVEAKAMFFAQYWGQKVRVWAVNGDANVFKVGQTYMSKHILKNCSLLLKPLSSITNEDATEVAKILDFHDGDGLIIQRNKDHIGIYDKYNDEPFRLNTLYMYHNVLEIFSKDERRKVFQYDLERLLQVTDYLRSKGYALPWMGYSVEEMVQAGWVKLKG